MSLLHFNFKEVVLKTKRFLLIIALLSLTGCTNQNQPESNDTVYTETENTTPSDAINEQENSDTNADFYFSKSSNIATLGKYTTSILDPSSAAPLLYNGQYAGTVSINFSSYIKDSDWKNATVVAENIDHAYSVNYNVNLEPYFSQKADAVLVAKSSIVDSNGNICSGEMSTYWSGFTSRLELYPKTPSGNLETTIQQTIKKLSDDNQIKLELTDTANGISFDPIYFNIDALKKTIKNGGCYRQGDKIKITSTNGAEYTIIFDKAAVVSRYQPEAISSTDDEKRFRAIDIQYKVLYNSGPKNNNTPATFDPYDNNKLNPNVSYVIQGDMDTVSVSNEVLSDSRIFYDSDQNYAYSKKGDSIAIGSQTTVIESIKIPDNMIEPTDYIKLYLEFPEERFVQTDTEAATFNGRYITVLIKLTDSFAEEIIRKEVMSNETE